MWAPEPMPCASGDEGGVAIVVVEAERDCVRKQAQLEVEGELSFYWPRVSRGRGPPFAYAERSA